MNCMTGSMVRGFDGLNDVCCMDFGDFVLNFSFVKADEVFVYFCL